MIIINGTVVHPIYTRIIVSRSMIYAEIALHRAAIAATNVILGSYFELIDYGLLYVDAIIQQGETYIVQAYDPLAYAAHHMICDTNVPLDYHVGITYAGKSTQVLKELLTEQYRWEKSKIPIEILPPASDVGVEMILEIRYDVLFDAYRQIPELIDPQCRLAIRPWAGANRVTQYQPEYGSDTAILLAPAMIYDYAYHGKTPNYAIVAGKPNDQQVPPRRPIVTVPDPAPDPRQEIYIDAVHDDNTANLRKIGNATLTRARMEKTSLTLKMRASQVPAGLQPADSVYLQDDPTTSYAVQSIEYTTGATGEYAYVTIGGKAVTVADRINAIIAADYAARY